jgi:hypothetical protein
MNQDWDDAKLYKRFEITPSEVAFINGMIRPMDASDD